MKIHSIIYFAFFALLIASCQSKEEKTQMQQIFVASSMYQPLDRYLKKQGLKKQLSSAGSQELSLMIEQGESPLLFISAHQKDFERLIQKGKMKESKPWVCNRLSLVGAQDLLTQEGLNHIQSIGIAHENVPLGQYTQLLIQKMPLAWQQQFRSKIKIKALNALQLLQYLKNKEIDIAIIYETDAKQLPQFPKTELPTTLHINTKYYLVYQSDQGQQFAQNLIDHQQFFIDLGFMPCP